MHGIENRRAEMRGAAPAAKPPLRALPAEAALRAARAAPRTLWWAEAMGNAANAGKTFAKRKKYAILAPDVGRDAGTR